MKFKTAITLTALILVSACNKAETSATDHADGGAADAAKPAATASAGMGVPECDEYLTKVMACVKDKVPEAQRKMMEDGINASKASWAAVADKTQLAASCKQAMEQAKASYGAMGCSF